MHGAHVHAGAAAGALVVVHTGHVVVYVDGVLRAALLALHAADTACGAGFAGESAAVVVGAQHHGLLAFRPDPNHLFGAGLLAGAAAGALLRVHTGQAVGHGDGVELAGLHTVTVAQAAVLARRPAGVQGRAGGAALDALVP